MSQVTYLWQFRLITKTVGKEYMKGHRIFQALFMSGLLVATSQGAIAGGYYHSHHHHDHGGALVGALLVGGMLGYLIGESQSHYTSYSYRNYYSDYPPPTTVVYQRIEKVPVVVREASDSEFSGSECVMTREYTTTINVNGVEREAYGTRCMTPDGGWILGKAKIMPNY